MSLSDKEMYVIVFIIALFIGYFIGGSIGSELGYKLGYSQAEYYKDKNEYLRNSNDDIIVFYDEMLESCYNREDGYIEMLEECY